MKKLTIIIPTMWRSGHLLTMLPRYIAHELVAEILLIDNAPEATPEAVRCGMPKVTVMTQGENIYVNPAWNWGVSCAVTELVALVNDDLLMSRSDMDNLLVLGVSGLETYELIGMHIDNFKHPFHWETTLPKLHAVQSKGYGFGTFMLMQRDAYVMVPQDIKIWRGDHIQLRHCVTAEMSGIAIETPMSVTVNSNMNIQRVAKQDMLTYRKKYKHYDRGEGNMVKVCYTSVTGPYDMIQPPQVVTPGWEYWAFVDADYPYRVPAPWKKKLLPAMEHLTDAQRQRVVKLTGPYLDGKRPRNLRTVSIDGNMVLRGNLDALVAESGHVSGGVTMTRHWRSDCVYNEVAKCHQSRKDTPERLNAAEQWLREQKHPHHGGLMECGIMIRDWKNGRVGEAMDEWLALVLRLTHRDQITIPWIIRKYTDIKWRGMERAVREKFIRINQHGTKTKINLRRKNA